MPPMWARATGLRRAFDGRAREILVYAAAAALSLVAAIFLLQLPRADLRVPRIYRGDALLYSSVIKSVVDHGWFWRNPSVGVPGGLELYDYPNVAHESFHLLTIKALSAFSGNWALLLNGYFLLGFPLITLSAMAVFRHFGIGHGPAIVGSVLYSFLPSRLLKGEGHLFLDVFYQVPLAILVLLWVCGDAPPFTRAPGGAAGGPGSGERRRRTIAALLICGLNASTSAYYAFFTICLLVAAGIWATFERRSMRNAVAGVSLAAVIIVAMAALGLPSIVYHWRHGPSADVGRRSPADAELAGMKIAQLLLPVDGHRVRALRELKQGYNTRAPLVGENSVTSLGLVGDVGFLALLGALVSRRRSRHTPSQASDDLMRPLATLNVFAVLLGTIGGFGSLVAFLVYPQIRTYSRVNVLIGFFSLFAVVLLLERLRRVRPRLGAVVLPVVLAVGLLDQSTPLAVRHDPPDVKAFASDRDLVRHIEARVARGTAVFQVPYVAFPEAQVHGLMSYDLLRPYLHSSTLRWSLPTMYGRSGDLFVRELSQREPPRLLDTIAALGFGGLLIDRDGYADHGVATDAAFGSILGTAPLVSQDGRFAFFALPDDARRARFEEHPAELDRLLHPLTVRFAGGFSVPESDPAGTFRWCDHTGEIHVDNDAATGRVVSLRATFLAARPPARLAIDGDLLTARLDLTAAAPFAREIDVAPGHHVIRFSCDGRPAEAPADPRTLVWRVNDFSFQDQPATSGTPSR